MLADASLERTVPTRLCPPAHRGEEPEPRKSCGTAGGDDRKAFRDAGSADFGASAARTPDLPAVVGERLVGLGHAMRVVLLLDRGALAPAGR